MKKILIAVSALAFAFALSAKPLKLDVPRAQIIGTPVPVKAIDFVLYTPDKGMAPKAYDVYYDAYVESDHFPVVATFSIND